MRLLHVAAAVLNQTPLAWKTNDANIRAAIAEARTAGASLLLLPELCVTGYGCEDAFQSPDVLARAERMLVEILPSTKDLVVVVGLPIMVGGAIYNCAAVCVHGQLVGVVAKQFLAGDGIHYEPRWFKAWPTGAHRRISFAGVTDVPVGDLVLDVGGVLLGFEICEDAWVANRPGAGLARRGVDVILNPSASHFAFGKLEVRTRFVLEGSRAFGLAYVYANCLGNESGRAIFDGGSLIANGGRLVARGPRFGFDDVHLTRAVIDVDAGRMQRARLASFKPIIDEGPRVAVGFQWPKVGAQELGRDESLKSEEWELSPHIKCEELTRALSLALFDYARKAHARGFVVSLSGGADSAACACLISLMSTLGTQALGREAFLKRLGRGDVEAKSTEEIVGALLTCAYQATENSSARTLGSARHIASSIGARFHVLDVEPIRAAYVRAIEGVLGRRLTWETDDVVLQNIQARVRAPSIWMLANLEKALLLATSNRSEAAVGYATMDGDTAGGLSPLAGIDKAFLLEWLHWLETSGPVGVGPMPFLAIVNALSPTAELRPEAMAQTDESDLMPYRVLDAIERMAIRDKHGPLVVLELLHSKFSDRPQRLLATWVDRFFRLWSQNQWKRERYAPSFHVDDENLDPKTWCRFPILSGCFQEELDDMWRSIS